MKPNRVPVLSSRNVIHDEMVMINIKQEIKVREINLMDSYPREYVEVKQR